MYVVEKEQPQGETVDLNIYPVSNQYSAGSFENNSNWSNVLDQVDTYLQTADISVGEVDYRSVSNSMVSSYRIPNSRDELDIVTGLGERTGSDRDDYLVVDVMVVDDIQIQKDGSTVSLPGWVGNTPGALGLHGNVRNGIVVNASKLQRSSRVTAIPFAHMLGHYLGLRHTTSTNHNGPDSQALENQYGTTDPLDDTPVCTDMDERVSSDSGSGSGLEDVEDLSDGDGTTGKDVTGCPDYGNLMFPAAPNENSDISPYLTDDQQQVLEANPLVKP
jgi:hypothetical protein